MVGVEAEDVGMSQILQCFAGYDKEFSHCSEDKSNRSVLRYIISLINELMADNLGISK